MWLGERHKFTKRISVPGKTGKGRRACTQYCTQCTLLSLYYREKVSPFSIPPLAPLTNGEKTQGDTLLDYEHFTKNMYKSFSFTVDMKIVFSDHQNAVTKRFVIFMNYWIKIIKYYIIYTIYWHDLKPSTS